MIKLKGQNGNVELLPNIKVVDGEDGGYYIPNVDEAGNLTWTATDVNMPFVEGANIKGKDGIIGKDGESGVYVGNVEPENPEMLIWINPDGEASEALATESYVDEAIKNAEVKVDLEDYYTKTETDELIANAEVDVDLTNYYTKTEVDTAIENVELIPGPQGEKGDKGDPGENGQDGQDGESPFVVSETAPEDTTKFWIVEEEEVNNIVYSNDIHKIIVVDEYPEIEELNVLYIKKLV